MAVVVGVVLATRQSGSKPDATETASVSVDSTVATDPVDSDANDVTQVQVTEAITTSSAEAPTTTLEPRAAAGAELQRIRTADAPGVDAVVDQWVPQISSKAVGLHTDGITYDVTSILADHQALVDRYSGDRIALLWSSDFSTFKVRGLLGDGRAGHLLHARRRQRVV